MTGDCHVRFCGNVGVKFPCVTRCVTWTTFIEMLVLYYRWEQVSRWRLSGAVTKPPYAALTQWFTWWAIRKSGNYDFCRCEYSELNASESMMKPRKGNRWCQKQIATWGLRQSVPVTWLPGTRHPGLSWQDTYSGCNKEQVNLVAFCQIAKGSRQHRMWLSYKGQT
jgi:hypothetical protein